MKKNSLLLSVALVSVIALAACGESDNSDSDSADTPVVAGETSNENEDKTDDEETEVDTNKDGATDNVSENDNEAVEEVDSEQQENSEDEFDFTVTDEDLVELFEMYEETKEEAEQSLSDMQNIVYLQMSYSNYIEATFGEFIIAEAYLDEPNDVAFDVWIANDGFLGVEFTTEDGLSNFVEFDTMKKAHQYGADNYGVLY